METALESGDEEKEMDMKIVESHVARLSEHFESAVVIVTKRSHGSTIRMTRHGGNYYAAIGSVREWLDCESNCG